MMENKMNEKMIAGILGFAVGDALGVPVEFLSREELKRNPVKDMMGYGSHPVPDGTWSDDTSLMIAAMDSINEKNGIDYYDIMHKFAEWTDFAKYTATGKFFDIGISTNKAIWNYKRGIEPTNCGSKGFNENGNGSLMRILPFVYYAKMQGYNNDEQTILINQASSLTHAHEISRLGCKIYNDYIFMILNNVDKKDALLQLSKNNYSKYYSSEAIEKYKRILDGALLNLKEDDIKSSGYIVDSLEASLWCTVNSMNYEEAVLKAVNLGEDTDTIAAITGSMNGIIYGSNSIPNKWIKKLRGKDYLDDISNRFINVINGNSKKALSY